MKEIAFRKMHGLGNCFILIDGTRRAAQLLGLDLTALARNLCDRNFGIGADGLILAKPCEHADFEMQIINEDGSIAQMCGNGVRCFTRFVRELGLTERAELSIQTLAGLIRTRALGPDMIEVDMGEPQLDSPDVLPHWRGATAKVDASGLTFSFVSMGNPHAITFVENFDFDWRACGRAVENSDRFPNKTNVEFARVISTSEVQVKVWERGCGETMACGTGACAVTVAGVLEGLIDRREVKVVLPGGALQVEWGADNHLMMTGPAVNICEGRYWF
ncbi:MAG: diaminopimelate epimerase [Myxococcota bacterium]|jgi:diaminopimelate epimerase|nr:diaminopimelate epimerase [Myxococcota bacterium]